MRLSLLFLILSTCFLKAQELPSLPQLSIPALVYEEESFEGLNYKEQPFESSFTLTEVDLFNTEEIIEVNMMTAMKRSEAKQQTRHYQPKAFSFRENQKKSVITLEARADYQHYPNNSNNNTVRNSVYRDASSGLFFRPFYNYLPNR